MHAPVINLRLVARHTHARNGYGDRWRQGWSVMGNCPEDERRQCRSLVVFEVSEQIRKLQVL